MKGFEGVRSGQLAQGTSRFSEYWKENIMIARTWRAIAAAATAERYEAHFTDNGQEGSRHVHNSFPTAVEQIEAA